MSYDAEGVRRAVHDLLVAIGEDPDRDGLRDTPERMARAYAEMFAGLGQDPAEHVERVFDVGHEEMVLVRDIPMYSVCEHHLLPFHGSAHVGYIPSEDGRVTGLSKVARLVDGYARRPPGPGAPHPADRRRPRRAPGVPGRARRRRGRAPVHVHEGRAQARLQHGHLRRAWHHAQCRHPLRGHEPGPGPAVLRAGEASTPENVGEIVGE